MNAEREQISALIARCAYLKSLLLARSSHLPREWNLTSSEGRVVGLLLQGGVASHAHLIEALYWDRDERDDADGVVKAMILRSRRKLAPFGITIKTVFGFGYELDPPGKTIVLKRLEAAEAIAKALEQ